MRDLIFFTGNAGKLSEARQVLAPLGIRIVPRSIDFDEPRTDDLSAIARAKAQQALKTINAPFLVHDSAFYVHALRGFPGTFVNFALSTIGTDGILKLMEDRSDRSCHFASVLAYWDGETLRLFEAQRAGSLTRALTAQTRSQQYSELWRVFRPDGREKTLAEMSGPELKAFRESVSTVYQQLANLLQGEIER